MHCSGLRFVVLFSALIAAGCHAPTDGPDRERVDLVLITLDTTRADRIGAYGYAGARTPRIDALAARGVRFEHAFAPAPTTLPSHASLFTGVYPPAHGARVNGRPTLTADRTTLAQRLQQAGYRTAAFVGAFPLDSRFGLDRGFEVYDDQFEPRGAVLTYAERDGARVTDAALDWLRGVARVEAPLFLWVHYFDPHAPYRPPDPATGYDGEIAHVDAQIARLLSGFDEARSLARALVVLTADHGESLGEHGEETHGTFVYDSTLRVPLILAHPTLVGKPRRVDDRVVSLVDVFPTVLGLLALESPEPVDGLHLFDESGASDRAIYFETLEPLARYGWAPLRGLRTFEAKLIEAPEAEYYRLGDDPREADNRYAADEAAVGELRQRLVERFGPFDVEAPPPAEAEIDQEAARKLRALGYVGTRSAHQPARRQDPKRMLPLWSRIDDYHDLVRAGRHDEALGLIEEILAADPENGRALLLRGILLQSVGRLAEAERSVRASVAAAPDTDSWSRLAEILYLQERFDEGDAAVEQARRIDPRSGLACVAEGIGATLQQRYDDALRAFEQAQALDPANAGERAAELAELTRRMR